MKRYSLGVLMGNAGMYENDSGDYIKLTDLQASARAELLDWQPVSDGLPDAESNVMLALADGTTCEGFYDGHWEHIEGQPPLFRDVCADPLDVRVVIAWAEMPGGPARRRPAAHGACTRPADCECKTPAARAVCMHRKSAGEAVKQ